MLGYLSPVDVERNRYHVVEFYAGAARLAKLTTALGGEAAAVDKGYDTTGDNRKRNNSMDFNTSAGFLSHSLLSKSNTCFVFSLLVQVLFWL